MVNHNDYFNISIQGRTATCKWSPLTKRFKLLKVSDLDVDNNITIEVGHLICYQKNKAGIVPGTNAKTGIIKSIIPPLYNRQKHWLIRLKIKKLIPLYIKVPLVFESSSFPDGQL